MAKNKEAFRLGRFERKTIEKRADQKSEPNNTSLSHRSFL